MPTHKKKKIVKSPKKKKRVLIVFLILSALILFLLNRASSNWDGVSKLTIVSQDNENVTVTILDPVAQSASNIIIPTATQVEACCDLGTWRLGSLYDLGKKEGKGGIFLSRTLTFYFTFPVHVWTDYDLKLFSNENKFRFFYKFVIIDKSDLSLQDRLRLYFFLFKLKSNQIEDIDLRNGTALEEKELIDGSRGYVLVRAPSEKLLSYFSDTRIIQNNLKVLISDGSEEEVSKKIADVVEVLGAKVASINKTSIKENCEIYTDDGNLWYNLSQILGCSIKEVDPEGNYDMEIRIGNNYNWGI